MSYHPKGRNVIHNGNFNVWQRGTSFTSPTNAAVADRWVMIEATDGTVNVTQDTGAPTLGSTYSIKIACTGTDATIGAGQITCLYQQTEVQDFHSMLNGKPWVVSFWVKSFQTGTFCFGVKESGGTTSVPFEYTINASATWEKKVIQIPAPVVGSGTWPTTAGAACLQTVFTLASGAAFQGTLGTWRAADVTSTSNQTNFMSSTDNYIQFSQVQLEAGTAATEFDALVYADELARCQRYLVAYGGVAVYEFFASGLVMTTSTARVLFYLPTEMRAAPTPGYSAIGDFGVQGSTGTNSELTVIAADSIGKKTAAIICTGTGTPWTAGTPATLYADNTTAARLYLSAEI